MSINFNLDNNNSITYDVSGSVYYVDLARDWAVSSQLVQRTDYSSKYYAGKSKEYSQSALSNKNAIQTLIDGFDETVNEAIASVQAAETSALSDINRILGDILGED